MDESAITRQSAMALLMYIQRALPIVPTTGADWMAVLPAINVLEGVANGKFELEQKPIKPAE
jgi:hypothetical protein